MRRPAPLPRLVQALLAAGLLCSCEPAGKAFHLGGVGSKTGEGATYGISSHRAMQMAVAEWNARGGVLGQPVRLHFADDKGDPAEGAAVFTLLIRKDQVSAIVGAGMSKVSLVGAPICQSARVPMVTPSSTHPAITGLGDHIFRACFLDSFQGQAGARFAIGELRAQRAACLFDVGNDYTVELAECFRSTFQGLGGTVTAFEGHASGNPDFLPQLTKIVTTRPDLIYLPGFYNDAAVMARQVRDLGFRGHLLGADGWDSPHLLPTGGVALEGSCFTTHFAKDDPRPAAQGFVKGYLARYGELPDSHAALAYDATCLVLEAVRRAGSKDRQAIRLALAATDLEGVAGRIRFDPRRNPVKSAVVLQIKGGQLVYHSTILPPGVSPG
jgi:branched-chain amino acid transport system substrate-binding protein